MIKKPGILVPICFSVGVMIVAALYLLSGITRTPQYGFTRKFKKSQIHLISSLDIKVNSWYFAGLSRQRIYLGNYTAPITLFSCDHALGNSSYSLLRVPHEKKIFGEGLTLTIDSPNIFLTDRVSTFLMRGRINDSVRLIGRLDSIQFSKSIIISSQSVIIRTFDKSLEQNILTKAIVGKTLAGRASFKLAKLFEGTFSTDGMFEYNGSLGRLVYLYYYRNRFDVLDSDLNFQYSAKTIDTITTPQIKIGEIESEKISTMAAPPLTVNKRSCLCDSLLFVNSNLPADNENKMSFSINSVIDVYNIKNGAYEYSFYVPRFYDNKITTFIVRGKSLFALNDHYLLAYQIN